MTRLINFLSPGGFERRIFIFAFFLRAAFLWYFLSRGLDRSFVGDLYFGLAQAWLGWLPSPAFDATHPPLYTGFIAALLKLTGSPNPLMILVVQCFLGAASVVLTGRVAMKLVGETAARLGAFWVAVDPNLIFFTPQLQTETLFIFMMLIFFNELLDESQTQPSWRTFMMGAWGGACVLCRSVFAGYPAALFFAFWRARGFSRAAALIAILGAGWLIPMGGWTARNYHKYGRFIPMSAQMGWTLYEGFTLDREEIRRRPHQMAIEAAEHGLTGNVEIGDYFMRKTLAEIRLSPVRAARIVAGKALLFWRPIPYDPYTKYQRIVMGAYFIVLFIAALLGVMAVRSDPRWLPIWGLFAYVTAAHSVFFTSLRYRLPLEPFLCLLAAQGVLTFLAWERRRRA